MEKRHRILDFLQDTLSGLSVHFLATNWTQLIALGVLFIGGVLGLIAQYQNLAFLMFGITIVILIGLLGRFFKPRFLKVKHDDAIALKSKDTFHMFDLSAVVNHNYPVKESPFGVIMSSGVPIRILPYVDRFQITGHTVIKIQPKDYGVSNRLDILCDISNVKRIYIVWTAGNGWRFFKNIQFEGRRIGILQINFSDGSNQIVQVILGHNIREWTSGDPQSPRKVSRLNDSAVSQFWESKEGLHVLDLMKIEVQQYPKHIRSLSITAQFEFPNQLSGAELPQFQISAITFETM